MKLLHAIFTAFLVTLTVSSRLVIVNFPPDISDGLYDAAKDAFIEAGGEISHEFHLIKAFSSDATNDAINALHSWTMSNDLTNKVVVEDEQTVSIPPDGSPQ